jgi:hypothetical protein
LVHVEANIAECLYVLLSFGATLKGDTVKNRTVAFLLFLSALAWAAPNALPLEYNIDVHVSASRMILEGNDRAYRQLLSVTIDGKKYELHSIGAPNMLLMLGDYKARLEKDEHGKGAYDSWRVYEFQFPDKRTRKFLVVEQSE